MRSRRFTLVYAMIAIVGTARALAALHGSSDLWWIATFLATLGLLAWSTLGAILLRGAERGPWLGTAIFGWLFFGVVYTKPIFADFRTPIYAGLQFLGERVHTEPLLLEAPVGNNPVEPLPPPRTPWEVPPISRADEARVRILVENDSRLARTRSLRANFSATLLLLINVAFALVGGLAGRSFARRIPAGAPPGNPIGYNRE
jgi:hypothetical protein